MDWASLLSGTDWIAVLSLLLAVAGALSAWIQSRRTELRREDVLAWGNEAIAALETIYLTCDDEQHAQPAPNARLDELRFKTSILVEQGRLFFRNARPDGFGADKEPAYRGYRPCVLDPLVVGHQIASAWPSADLAARARIRLVAGDCLRTFVSLMQKEVGRSRTASADTSEGGDGADLGYLMSRIAPLRLPPALRGREGRIAPATESSAPNA